MNKTEEITEQDNITPVQSNLLVADIKVLIQVIDRLFSIGGVKGSESLPIAVVRQKLVSIADI
jgi:hypothetical protein